MFNIKNVARILILVFFTPTLALAQGNGNGNGGNPNQAIADLQQDVADINADIAQLDAELLVVESNLSSDISQLQSELTQSAANLQSQIDSMKLTTVSADCQADANALQDVVDAAPAAGAIIQVNGNCNSTVVFAKRNLIIDGGGNTLISGDTSDDTIAALYIEGSVAIQISGIEVDANGDSTGILAWDSQIFLYDSSVTSSENGIDINRGSTAIMANVDSTSTNESNSAMTIANTSLVLSDESLTLTNATGQPNAASLRVQDNSTYSQASGTFNTTGTIFLTRSGTAFVQNGNLYSEGSNGVLFLMRSSSIQARPDVGQSVTITGATIPQGEDPDIVVSPIWAFSGSDVVLTGSGGVTVNGHFAILQRFSSIFASGAVNFNLNLILVRQNAVVDIVGVGPTFSTMPNVNITLGGGVRNTSGIQLTSVSCDDSAWTSGQISCP